MTAWHMLAMAAVSAVGGAAFLKTVADELAAVTDELRGFEERERVRARQRRAAAAKAALNSAA
jgi:hypothetical protein